MRALTGSARRGDKASAGTWHKRMGHARKDVVELMYRDAKYGMVIEEKGKIDDCETFVVVNQNNSKTKVQLVSEDDDITLHCYVGRSQVFCTFFVTKSLYCGVALQTTRD